MVFITMPAVKRPEERKCLQKTDARSLYLHFLISPSSLSINGHRDGGLERFKGTREA